MALQGDFVWLLKDDKTVQMQPVRVQLTEGSRTILMSGLSEGQMVVVDGADRLRNGSKVDPRQAQAKTAQASGAPGAQAPPDTSAPATSKNGRMGAPAEKKTRQQ